VTQVIGVRICCERVGVDGRHLVMRTLLDYPDMITQAKYNVKVIICMGTSWQVVMLREEVPHLWRSGA